jgi:hypothetical protein
MKSWKVKSYELYTLTSFQIIIANKQAKQHVTLNLLMDSAN